MIGVLDDGCPFAAAQFSDCVRYTGACIWDQNRNKQPITTVAGVFGQVPSDFRMASSSCAILLCRRHRLASTNGSDCTGRRQAASTRMVATRMPASSRSSTACRTAHTCWTWLREASDLLTHWSLASGPGQARSAKFCCRDRPRFRRRFGLCTISRGRHPRWNRRLAQSLC